MQSQSPLGAGFAGAAGGSGCAVPRGGCLQTGCRFMVLPIHPAAEDLALHLAQAIEYGDEEVASQCAVALARQQATLSILLKESNYPTDDIR